MFHSKICFDASYLHYYAFLFSTLVEIYTNTQESSMSIIIGRAFKSHIFPNALELFRSVVLIVPFAPSHTLLLLDYLCTCVCACFLCVCVYVYV